MAAPGEAAERARRLLHELESRKQPAFDLMVRRYESAKRGLESDILRLAARKAGDPQLDVILERRLALLDVIEKRMAEYESAVRGATKGLVRDSAKAGLEHGAGQMQAWGIAQGVGVNEHAVAALMAQTNPTRDYLKAIPQLAKQRAETILTNALILGWGPKRVVQELAGIANIARYRAETIARTEMLRAYREGNRAQWAANPSLVHGWVWACTPSVRTCPVCFSMSGTFHPITESFTSHPNCRCTMIPVPTNYASSLAQYQLKPLVPKGEEQLLKMSAEDQRRILGPTRYDAFKNGASLKHMVEEHWDPTYGTQRRLRKLPKVTKPKAAPPLAGVVGKRRAPGVSIPDNMTLDEHSALSRYTSSSSLLNSTLRQNPGMGAAAFDHRYYEREQTSLLDAMMERTAAPADVTVYRGASAHYYGNHFVDGAIIEDHGFVSTSYDTDPATSFRGDLMLHIHVPAGSRGIDVNASTNSGYHPAEREFILPRGSRFRVTLAEQETDRFGNMRWNVFVELITP